jgi:hypothetical protein
MTYKAAALKAQESEHSAYTLNKFDSTIPCRGTRKIVLHEYSTHPTIKLPTVDAPVEARAYAVRSISRQAAAFYRASRRVLDSGQQ